MPSDPGLPNRAFPRLLIPALLLAGLVWTISFPRPAAAQDTPAASVEEMVRQIRQCPAGLPAGTPGGGPPGAPTPAPGGPPPSLDPVLDRILAAGLDNDLNQDQTRAVLALFLDACGRNLPLPPLADKAAEGLAKRVPGDRLVSVLAALLDDLTYAAERMPGADGRSVAQAGSALAAGLDRDGLDAILALDPDAPPAMQATAAEAASLLLAAGYPRQGVLDALAQGLTAHSLTPDWRHLPSLAVRAEKRGLDRQAILDKAGEALAQGRSIRQFMEDIGFTGRDLQHGDTPR